jgi:exopolysaccharide biosynthesis WecB/TagA/CpsF family protein
VHADIPSITMFGVPIASLTTSAALARVEDLHDRDGPALVAFANAHTLNLAARDAGFRGILQRADLLLNDGSGVALAARLQGRRFPDNLNGTDLSPEILALARQRGWRVYFLGARPGIAEAARDNLVAQLPGLTVVGVRHGYFSTDELTSVVDDIRRHDADVLFVAMGNPVQERWLDANLAATGARVGIAVGAFLDFSAGVVSRSPTWVRRLGIEWLYRLYLEPGRMWRRYVLGNPLFLWRAMLERLRRRRGVTRC